MKYIKLTTLIFGLLLFGCNQADSDANMETEEKVSTSTDDKDQIQNLIRQMLNWADSKKSIDLLPVLSDRKDSVYIGFDLDKHEQNLDKLRKSNFFTTEFIENYDRIMLTLDKGLKNGYYEQWLVGDLPTFTFSNDFNPWTLSQDIPYDKPNPFDFVEVNISNLDKGEAEWRWGKLELNANKDWRDFLYKFNVVKEDDNWKVDYLTGFDFKESTRKV